MIRPSAPLLLLLLLAPAAVAADLLPDEARMGETEARLVVRSPAGEVRVAAEPPVLADGVPPGATPADLRPTPRLIDATHRWRGLDAVVEIVLRRGDPSMEIAIIIDDGRSGVWVDWPAAARAVPAPQPLLLLLALAACRGPLRASAKGFGAR